MGPSSEHVCVSCGSRIKSDVLSGDGICISCYFENVGRGEATRRSDPEENWEKIGHENKFDRAYEYLAEVGIENIDDAVDRFDDCIEQMDSKLLLGEAMVHLTLSRRFFHTYKKRQGFPPKMVEYLLAAVSSKDRAGDEVNLYEVMRPLRDIRLALNLNVNSRNSVGTESERQRSIAYDVALRELIAGRFAKPTQHLEAARRLYSDFDEALMKNYKFKIKDAIEIANVIQDRKSTLDKAIFQEVGAKSVSLIGLADKAVEYEPSVPQVSAELSGLKEKVVELGDELPRELYWVSESELLAKSSLSYDRTRHLLNELSVSLGDANQFRRPADHNPLHEYPLLSDGSEYLLPPKGVFEFALAKSFYYRLRSTPEADEDRIGDVRGDVTEEWTHDILKTAFDNPTVLHEVYYDYPKKGEETDVLLKNEDTLFIFECKAKMLTKSTRAGDHGGLDTLHRDIMKGIGKGYNQAKDLAEGIEEGEILTLTDGTTTINVSDIDTIHICPTTLEPYDSVTNHGFKEFIDIGNRIPYPVSVYDLEGICANLDSPDQLATYCEWRKKVISSQALQSSDEMDYLQLFLDNAKYPDGPTPTLIYGLNRGLRDAI